MSNKLPRGYFDLLADETWDLTKLSMQGVVESAPALSSIKGQFYHGDLCFEPEFDMHEPYPEVFAKTPRHLGLTVSETEPYEKNENFTIYSYRKFTLDTALKSLGYRSGIIMLDDLGNAMTPHVEMKSPGKVWRRNGNLAWRAIQPDIDDRFDKNVADDFLQKISKARTWIELEGAEGLNE